MVKEIWNRIDFPENSTPILLNYRRTSHTKPSVADNLANGTYLDFIPVGYTSLAQILDLCFHKVFKDHLRRLFEKRLEKEGVQEANKTKKGNLSNFLCTTPFLD